MGIGIWYFSLFACVSPPKLQGETPLENPHVSCMDTAYVRKVSPTPKKTPKIRFVQYLTCDEKNNPVVCVGEWNVPTQVMWRFFLKTMPWAHPCDGRKLEVTLSSKDGHFSGDIMLSFDILGRIAGSSPNVSARNDRGYPQQITHTGYFRDIWDCEFIVILAGLADESLCLPDKGRHKKLHLRHFDDIGLPYMHCLLNSWQFFPMSLDPWEQTKLWFLVQDVVRKREFLRLFLEMVAADMLEVLFKDLIFRSCKIIANLLPFCGTP